MPDIRVNEEPYRAVLAARNKRFIFLFGGAASSKSWTIAQYLLFEKFFAEKNVGIMPMRKVRATIKDSCWRLLHYWIKAADKPISINKSDLIIRRRGGNFIECQGIDDVEKRKSLEGINYIWIEEATEVTKKEFMQLNLRCRAKNENGINQIFVSFNPIDPENNEWLKTITERGWVFKPDDALVLRINYDDNPFLHENEIEQILTLANEDEEYDKIYRKGEWAYPQERIYSNWDIVECWPKESVDSYWGLDFGFVNQSALVEIQVINEKIDEVWERQHIYKSGLVPTALLAEIEKCVLNKNQLIVADSAEPSTITVIRNAGFNIQAVTKTVGGGTAKKFVAESVKVVQGVKTHILADSPDLIKEKGGYKWKVNKDGLAIDGEPVKFRDHLLDAERYVLWRLKNKTKAGIVTIHFGDDEDEDRMWKIQE